MTGNDDWANLFDTAPVQPGGPFRIFHATTGVEVSGTRLDVVASLLDRWRPRTLSDIRGQDYAVRVLQAFLEAPHSTAFLFAGDTGTGKTSAAIALARELGVDVDQEEWGGLYQVPSGEQTGETVRALVASLGYWPAVGSGWRVAIVNECDRCSESAAYTWLDVLESLPPRVVVIFTTNKAEKMPARWRDRCTRLDFISSAMLLRTDVLLYIQEVWKREGGVGPAPKFEDLNVVEDGNVSFRRVLQALSKKLTETRTR